MPKKGRSRSHAERTSRQPGKTVARRREHVAVAAAVETKKIGFKFTGTWDHWGALVDDSDELDSPDDSRNLPAGGHSLSWTIEGAPGAPYTVSISGCSPKDWSRDFKIGADGEGIGSHPFQVTIP